MPLKVKIFSFGFQKSGVPLDDSGNNGGFVFDCRFLYNPGRKEEFREMCGKDKAVCEFIESQSKMKEFLENASRIIDAAIENYTERDFSNMMISFGCTGGQHRSVYAAEKMKEHIEAKFPEAITEIYHTELEKSELFRGKLG
jgi:UPF0042 nucleotide-binding protein